MQIDKNGDAAWYQEYFNEPLSEENQIFRRDFFRYYNDYQLNDIKKKPHRIYTLVDPAISKKTSADFTAIVTLLVDIMGRIYWLEIIRERLNPMETIRALFAAYERWRPEKVGVETVAYQKALVFFIEEEKKRTASLVKNMIIQEIRADSDKERKIRALQPKYAIGSVFHRENDPMTRILEQELLRFPKAAHDDIIDAGSGVFQLIIPPRKPVMEAHNKFLGISQHRQVSY
jgi:predicted phage terminase large subunit-like protein